VRVRLDAVNLGGGTAAGGHSAVAYPQREKSGKAHETVGDSQVIAKPLGAGCRFRPHSSRQMETCAFDATRPSFTGIAALLLKSTRPFPHSVEQWAMANLSPNPPYGFS
jgi:hypothetical protein